MSEELLPYYNRELTFLRKVGEQFAQQHPKIAGRLRLGSEGAEDPHVERLIEAVAFLNGRIQHRLDDDFPEISDALLSVLHPQFLAPIPSMSIVRFAADPEATAKYVVAKGAELETERIGGNACVYRTCFETDVWPIDIVEASLMPTPFDAPTTSTPRTAVACLRLTVSSRSGARLADLELSQLRLHLRGLTQHVHPLYELLLNDVIGVSLARSPGDRRAIELGKDCIRPAGLEPEESVLPDSSRSSPAYRLLTEFFAFPQSSSSWIFMGWRPPPSTSRTGSRSTCTSSACRVTSIGTSARTASRSTAPRSSTSSRGEQNRSASSTSTTSSASHPTRDGRRRWRFIRSTD